MEQEKVKQALAIVKQVCDNFRGTLQEHQAIQGAMRTLEQATVKEEPKEKKKE